MSGLTQWGLIALADLGAVLSVSFAIRSKAKYKCDCGHSLAYHDDKGCNKKPWSKNGTRCECVRYIGKSPQSEVDELAKKRPWRSQGS